MLRKVTPEDAPKISDAIMTSLLQMLSSSSGKVGGVQEDALLAVSTLVEGQSQVSVHVTIYLMDLCKWFFVFVSVALPCNC